MKLNRKINGEKLSELKSKLSFKNNGITSYHAAPAALMAAAGLALSFVISDVPPEVNKVFAASIEEQFEMNVNMFNEFTTQLSGENGQAKDADEDKANNGVIVIPTVDDLCEFKKDEVKPEAPEYDFSAHTTYLGEDGAAEKLKETALAERQEELDDARGQAVASYNKNLYLDTYSYQRGPSNIPSTGEYTSCIPGTPISQLQPPESLTFDENGVPENYLYCIEGKSTAYYGGYMTATGSPTRPGVVAVDPREIPYGTEMWIVSEDGRYVYGFARAEDTGGFIYWENGATVDLYMNSYADCCVWGWRGVKIYVLPTSYK